MIIEAIKRSCNKYSDNIAIRYGKQSYTYQEFWNLILETEKVICKVDPIFPVGIYMKNHPQYLFVYYALLKNGYIPMLIDSTFTTEEVNKLCKMYNIKTVISLDSNDQIVTTEMEITTNDYNREDLKRVTTCRFSSGTTGIPKCIKFSSEAIYNAGINWAKAAKINENDNILCTASLHNGLGFNTSLISTFANGATLFFIDSWLSPRKIWSIVEKENITILTAFPFVYDLLSNYEGCSKNHNLRLCYSSSAPLHHSTKEAFFEKTNINICDYYGIVECGPVTFNDGKVPLSLGKPIDGVDIRIVDENSNIVQEGKGIIQIKSNSMSSGYYKNAKLFNMKLTEDGYFHTNDVGYFKDGYLYVLGRQDDSINVAGKKVDPVEIENVLRKYPNINDVVVTGYKSEKLGTEYPVAFYTSEIEIDKSDLIDYLRPLLAPFKLPQKFIRIKEIPRSGIGKVKRKELQKILS